MPKDFNPEPAAPKTVEQAIAMGDACRGSGLLRIKPQNRIFAAMAQAAMAAYDRATGDPGSVTDERLFQLLLASLLHKCDAEGWDFAKEEKEARKVYLAELYD